MKISLLYFKQANDYYCGPAVLQMILQQFGQTVSQEEIAATVETSQAGTLRENLGTFLETRKFNIQIQTKANLADLEKLVERGSLVVVNYVEPEEEGHYAIVTDYNQDDIILHDPWHGPDFHLKHAEFDERWAKRDRWIMVVLDYRHVGVL